MYYLELENFLLTVLFLVVVLLRLLVLDVLFLVVVHHAVENTLLALMVDSYMFKLSSVVLMATGAVPWSHSLFPPPLSLLSFSSPSSLSPPSAGNGCRCCQSVLGEVGPTRSALQHGGTRSRCGALRDSDRE